MRHPRSWAVLGALALLCPSANIVAQDPHVFPSAPVETSRTRFDPECVTPDHKLRIDLRWKNTSVDLDLHVRRPEGSEEERERYFDNQSGDGCRGDLSDDWVPLFDPPPPLEVFQVEWRDECTYDASGRYEIAVHFYDGVNSGPVSWSMVITVFGDTTFSCSGTVASPDGDHTGWRNFPNGSSSWSRTFTLKLPSNPDGVISPPEGCS